MPRKKHKATGSAANGHALPVIRDAQRQAYERTRAVHQRPLPDPIPKFEKLVQAAADAGRIDELKLILDDTKKLQACARMLESREAEMSLAEIRANAWRHLGQISHGLRKGHGPGRGKKRISTDGKSLALAAAKISLTSAHRAEKIAAIRPGEFDRYLAECRAQGRPAKIDDLIRRQRLAGSIRVRPYNKHDFFRSRHTIIGEEGHSGRVYAETREFSTLDRITHATHVLKDLPDRERAFVTWLSDQGQIDDFHQHLWELPRDKWQRYVDGLLEEHDEGVVDFVEATREAHEVEQPQRRRKERKFNSARRR